MRLLLHACCGPCLIEPLDRLRVAHDVTVAYANPNIHPLREYERRRDTLIAYAGSQSIDAVEFPYEPAEWVRAVAAKTPDKNRRCRACFALRLGAVASYAAANGFEAFATTLTVSPYQDVDALRDAAEEASRKHGVGYCHTDFRAAYPDAVRRSRELGMYRQNYCGCLLSQVEAARERAERKAARSAAKARR
jgi:epoxyqueuosine reductase